MPAALDPQTEYQRRQEVWRAHQVVSDQLSKRIGNLRLGLAGLAAVLAWFAFAEKMIAGWWLLVPLAAFIALVVYHERVVRKQQFAKRALAYYQRAILRLDDRWQGTGSSGAGFARPDHVYADDLDIFGRGSLFELLSTARTAAGEHKLAGWLLAPAPADDVRGRQEAIAELRDAVQLREDLALLGEDVRAGVHVDLLTAWAEQPGVHFFRGARMVGLLIAAASLFTFIGFMAHLFTLRPFLIAVVAAIVAGMALRRGTMSVTAAVDTAAHDLQILSLILERIEREQFSAPLLQRIRADLDTGGLPASRRISRLSRWVEFLDSYDHLAVRLIGPPLMWKQQAAMGIEAWRCDSGRNVGRWIGAISELEALSSLASFHFERPTATFPELLETGPHFEALELRHPLMSPLRAVPNDLRLDGQRRLHIVSGSNMSGKSTLLRAVGLNTVLAWAGAPVTALSLRVSPLAAGASIRIVDSLQDGKSRFYAEITRLRQIVELLEGDLPVLFLLDEVLSGTNSHDRRIGAEAVIRTLVNRGAIGLVTTHDLALTQIQDHLDGRSMNVHFEDHLEDGRISFDYKLKPGVVERSNALELMRAVGLDV
jgi:hypothetical protein